MAAAEGSAGMEWEHGCTHAAGCASQHASRRAAPHLVRHAAGCHPLPACSKTLCPGAASVEAPASQALHAMPGLARVIAALRCANVRTADGPMHVHAYCCWLQARHALHLRAWEQLSGSAPLLLVRSSCAELMGRAHCCEVLQALPLQCLELHALETTQPWPQHLPPGVEMLLCWPQGNPRTAPEAPPWGMMPRCGVRTSQHRRVHASEKAAGCRWTPRSALGWAWSRGGW